MEPWQTESHGTEDQSAFWHKEQVRVDVLAQIKVWGNVGVQVQCGYGPDGPQLLLSSQKKLSIHLMTRMKLEKRQLNDSESNITTSKDYQNLQAETIAFLVVSLLHLHLQCTSNSAIILQGCDASILISTRPGSKDLAERDAEDNKDLAMEAFDSIKKAKALVESKCPGVVSCADILAIAARDFVHLTGGPYYQVKKGRWDGKFSMASRVSSNIPHSNSTVNELLRLFNSKGLTQEDLVVLSGAHTIGFSHCKHFANRLYNYKGTKLPDPNIDPRLLKALKISCPQFGGNADIVAPFDVTTTFSFDNAYYGNIESKLGLLASDQALSLDPRTKPLVQALAKDKQKFFLAFAAAMDKMGSIGVKRGPRHGEKRRDCSMHV